MLEEIEGATTLNSGGGGNLFSVQGMAIAANNEPGDELTFKAMFHRFKILKITCDTSIRLRSVVDKFSDVDQLL